MIEFGPKDCGSSDKKDWWQYVKKDTTPSCDKGSHKERSLHNQPNHQKHWIKVKKEK
jgi:hypothetical protein